MKPEPPFSLDGRREFVKKSLAASIVAAQPTILAGLIRAEGGGGGGGGETTVDPWEETTSESTVETTVPSERPLLRKYRIKIYIKGNGAAGWIYTKNPAQAEIYTNDDLPQGAPPVGVNIPSVPMVGGFSLALYLSQNTPTTDPLKSGFPDSTTAKVPFAEDHSNPVGGYAKGFAILVEYEWQYGQ